MAKYLLVKEDLLNKILDGTYPEGSTIPTEIELAEAYGVSRPTIRQAIQILATGGYLKKRKRHGTMVTRPKISQGFAQTLQSFEDELHLCNRSLRTNVIHSHIIPATQEVADALQIARETPVIKLIRLRFVDDIPNVYVESYLPAAVFPDALKHDFAHERLYAVMKESDHPVKRATRQLEVVSANSYMTKLLEVDEGDPLFLFHSIGYDDKSLPVEYSIATYRGQSNSFTIEVNIAD